MLIGIDLDSVVADIMPPLIDYHNKNYGTSLVLSDYKVFELGVTWRCSREEVLSRAFNFYRSSWFDTVKPVKGAIEGIEYLSRNCELHIITSRPNIIKEKTDKWIFKYFPKKFKTIHHTNQFSKKGGKNKSEICQSLGIKMIIEDSLAFAHDCSSSDIKVLLMDMPWNQSKTLPKNITRVYGWKDIIDLFTK